MTKTERKFMVDPQKDVKEEAVPGNFCITDDLIDILDYDLIITKAMFVSISKEGQNMTETDINYSESFIYQIGEKVYDKSKGKIRLGKVP